MTREEVWEIVVASNPSLKNADHHVARITVAGFRKAINYAYDKGHAAATEQKSLWETVFGKH